MSFCSCLREVFAIKAGQLNKSVQEKPDYSDLYYWASHPWKKDFADKVPLPLKNSSDSIADVFLFILQLILSKYEYRMECSIK